MTTKIYLVRHAEAEGNLFRIAHGQYNSTITPRGYRQLAHLRERFRDVHLDAVYGSDLLRAQTTASALYVPRGLPFLPEPRLREVDLGCWEQRTWADIQRDDLRSYIDFNKHPDRWHIPGGEDFDRVKARAVAAIRDIAAAHPGETVAAAGHGAALRALLSTLQGLSPEEWGASKYGDNTAVSLLEVTGEDIRVVFRDDVSHIPPEASTFRRQKWHKNDQATEPGLWFRTVAEDGGGRTAEAMLDEAPAGRVGFVLEPDGLRITEYELLPELRGQRYGVQLLGQAVQFARTHGKDYLLLACPAGAEGYFSKYGFVPSGGGDMVMDIRLIIHDIG